MTVTEALRGAETRLDASGVARADAERLLRFVLGWDRAQLLAEPGRILTPAEEARYVALVALRASRRPLQHLIGAQAFWRHDFKVTPDVLIPRPETEILVEAALHFLEGIPAPTVVDVGTGSGCIAVSLAAERPDATLYAVDLSEAALEVARENARAAGVLDRVRFRRGDLLEPVRPLAGRLAAVVSNPPYVDPSEASSLPPEVRDHEPAMALLAPGERYSVYRRLIPEAAALLRPGGGLLLEVGLGMDGEVSRLCRESGFEARGVLPDLQGIPRTVLARLPDAEPPAVD